MISKQEAVLKYLKVLGPVALKNLSEPVNIPFGTLMNIRGGVRSTSPRYDNIYALYQHFKGHAPCELEHVRIRLKAMTTKAVRECAVHCGLSFHTLIKIKQGQHKYAPSYNHVHAAYLHLKKTNNNKNS